MLLCFAVFGVARAQETLTVFDGAATNSYVPVYGTWADAYNKCEMIMPAADLADMENGTISKLTWYLSTIPEAAWNGNFKVYLNEVSETTLETSFLGVADATLVFEGPLDATSGLLEIEFGTDYFYGGGNLFIAVYQTETGTWKGAAFSGTEVAGASISAYNSTSIDNITTGTARNFLPKTTFEYTPGEAPACPKPTGLTINYTGGTTAEVSWNSEATNFNIDVNGTVTAITANPYTLTDLEFATTYEVKVQAVCSANEVSDWTSVKSFTTDLCELADMCEITFELTDSYGDGWNGNAIKVVDVETGVVLGQFANTNAAGAGEAQTYSLAVCEGRDIQFIWVSGSYVSETSFVVYDAAGNVILEGAGAGFDPVDYTMACPTCMKPNGLTATSVGTDVATLNWIGSNDSYEVQYRTAAQDMNMNVWSQVGNDIITTGVLTEYTFDLSEFEGTGSIAIRHYSVSDMFRLNVDDIVVTNAAGTEVVNEGFEGGSIPSGWSILDMDGDGQNWTIASTTNNTGNGSYVIVSASYNNVALTPDNWLVIPNVELGGTLTLVAVGQDPEWAGENFGVFVATQSYDAVEAGEWITVTTEETSVQIEDLEPNTPYEWQVKGFCDEEETSWATSTFNTLPDGFMTFVTDGDWDDENNWFPVGVPTADDEVSIEADAIITAGTVAYAKKATVNGGSITIQDGGQLKQGSATVKVTVEKEIAGYGEGTGNYYFISSPFSGRTLYSETTDWNHVEDMFDAGEYDLYAFDPAAELEWINYKSQPSHIAFESSNGNAGLYYGLGYLYANQEGTTLKFVGSAAKSIDYAEAVSYDLGENTFGGWALVGNFFSCDAYLYFIDADGEPMEADFYTMNADGNGYDLSSSDVTLPVCTGAFVNYGESGMVLYATERLAPAKAAGMLNMTVTEGRSQVDMARIRFGEGYNLGKKSFRENSSSLYMPVNGNDYAVVYAEEMGEMPVNFKAENNGSYTISFAAEDVEFSYLHLIDNMTGADIDLLETPSYSFDAKTSDYASRFRLVFATGNANESSDFAFMSDGNIIVNGEGTLQVIDMTGRVVSTSQVNGMSSVNVNAAGVYVLQLTNGNETKIQKIVVK